MTPEPREDVLREALERIAGNPCINQYPNEREPSCLEQRRLIPTYELCSSCEARAALRRVTTIEGLKP